MIPTLQLHDQIIEFKKLMHSLTTEKDHVTAEIKLRRQEKTYLTAKKLFSAEGNEANTILEGYLREIASVKPGRKLIKALENTKCHLKVELKDRLIFRPYHSTVFIDNTNAISYNTLNSSGDVRKTSSPTWIAFAHELIHALHHFSNPEDPLATTSVNIFPKMDSLEEQRTIIGFHSKLFSKKDCLAIEDVICENAFYMALGLPVRVDHTDETVEQELSAAERPNSHDGYYTWLESTQKNISQIPEDKVGDKEFLFNFLCRNPAALKSLPPHLKKDADFMIQFMDQPHVNLLEELPELSENEDFVMKLLEFNLKFGSSYALSKVPPKMLKSPTFIARLTHSIKTPTHSPSNKSRHAQNEDKAVLSTTFNEQVSEINFKPQPYTFRQRLFKCAVWAFEWIKKLCKKLLANLSACMRARLNRRFFSFHK